MKKTIFILFLLFILVISPASADLFNEMNQKVLVYNQNVDRVPGVIKSLLGNEEIHGIIDLNDGSKLEVKAVTKEARVIEFGKVGTEIAPGKGDCNKDDDLTALDALCALKMSVGKMQTHESIDVDEDGKVTSLDARIILQAVVGWSPEVNPTIVVKTDEDTMRSIMNSQKPVDTFLDALDSGAIKIEAVGVVKGIILSIGKVVLQIARSLGIL
ncbi:MAG: hypothetical protein SCAL_000064 [Candidatus Syntrophoarchaeum caldarius]|uniref:Dockerin domain-containing protein n=1 Tax=Candidatus Syntropharchaeum caldarium TaxID=1838285 RepID=A0A1F2PAY0_9EURY|nr:MAG: hypothetical protein SCAL_000064 [Candidatus Syntrophoarchaeum caldarius]